MFKESKGRLEQCLAYLLRNLATLISGACCKRVRHEV